MTKYMFDAELFNRIMDDYLENIKESSENTEYYITLEQCKKVENDSKGIFHITEKDIIDRQTCDLAISLLDNIKEDANNSQNAYIMEVCKARGYTLVSGEKHIAEIIWKYGGNVKSLREFLKAIDCDRYKELTP